eukprot:scaffold8842_cov13-Prasinocladus_malaysianus.AAC.1
MAGMNAERGMMVVIAGRYEFMRSLIIPSVENRAQSSKIVQEGDQGNWKNERQNENTYYLWPQTSKVSHE